MKNPAILFVVVFVAIATPSLASGVEPPSKSDVCTLEDGKQVSLRYQLDDHDSTKLRIGQIWPQPDRPMLLFTQTPLRIDDSSIPIGAFSVYVIAGKRQWTLVVNSGVTHGQYDPHKDLVRASMATGDISGREAGPKIWFGHGSSNGCEFRFYQGSTGAFIELQERQLDTLSAAQH